MFYLLVCTNNKLTVYAFHKQTYDIVTKTQISSISRKMNMTDEPIILVTYFIVLNNNKAKYDLSLIQEGIKVQTRTCWDRKINRQTVSKVNPKLCWWNFIIKIQMYSFMLIFNQNCYNFICSGIQQFKTSYTPH